MFSVIHHNQTSNNDFVRTVATAPEKTLDGQILIHHQTNQSISWLKKLPPLRYLHGHLHSIYIGIYTVQVQSDDDPTL